MIRSFVALILLALFVPTAQAGQPNAPVLALWEFDGWAMPTPERPLGLRFALLEDGRVLFAPDDPAIDALIPNQYFQAQLTPAETKALIASFTHVLQQPSQAAPEKQRGWTAFYFRDTATGEQRHAEVAGHPCLAKGRVFSATAPVAGLQAVQNSADRAALPPPMREACNLLAGFHHATAQPWSPQSFPALVPQP
ncbi:MAG TPA: hypothetical protein VGF43_20605 [Dongiaceae bacterium]|jgi:hypothetical protein